MKKKIIIIGKKSFIGKSLFNLLKQKYKIKIYDYNKFIKLNNFFLDGIDYVINCSSNIKYVTKNYLKKNDFDIQIANKIQNLKCKQIFLSSRKIYKADNNIKETSLIKPNCIYSKNKLITENKLLKIIGNKVLILRITNLIGLNIPNYKNRKIHKTFIDNFFFNIKKGIIFDNKKIYKDFLSMNQFSKIIDQLIKKEITGIYNISIGKKIYLNTMLKWLNLHNKKKYEYFDIPKSYNSECFYLNNSKLMKKINIKIRLIDLEKDCKKISKLFFK